jgi:hypothetical protein
VFTVAAVISFAVAALLASDADLPLPRKRDME